MLLVNTLEAPSALPAANRTDGIMAPQPRVLETAPVPQNDEQSPPRLFRLPLFDRIAPGDVAPAIDTCCKDANQALETVTAGFPAEWSAISKVLDVATERLGRAWGAVSHLNSVADTPELRAAYNEALPRVTEFWTRLGADERLYAKYKAIDPALS
jgi:Zn-dependent oligopeptidase